MLHRRRNFIVAAAAGSVLAAGVLIVGMLLVASPVRTVADSRAFAKELADRVVTSLPSDQLESVKPIPGTAVPACQKTKELRMASIVLIQLKNGADGKKIITDVRRIWKNKPSFSIRTLDSPDRRTRDEVAFTASHDSFFVVGLRPGGHTIDVAAFSPCVRPSDDELHGDDD